MTAVVVPDHALLRFLERAMEIPVEDIRKMVADTPGLAQAVALGAKSFSGDGLTFRLDGVRIITIQPNGSPSAAHRDGYAHSKGYTPRQLPPRRGKRSKGRARGNGGRGDRAFHGGEE